MELETTSPELAAARYAIALLAVFSACIVQYLVWPNLQGAYPMLYLAAVTVAALRGGSGPALLATAVSGAKMVYFHMSWRDWVSGAGEATVEDEVTLLSFCLLSAGITWICHRLRRTRALREEAVHDAEFLERRYRDVLSLVSHDLRNPLSAILLNAHMLQRQAGAARDRKALEKQAALIQSSGQRMNALIESLVLRSRSEIGALDLQLDDCGLESILQDAATLMRPMADARGVRLVVGAAAEPSTLRCDRPTLILAISNLLDNAIRFSPAGGVVELSVMDRHQRVEIAVRDQGPGFVSAERDRLFDRLFQAARRPGAHGLSVTRGIVEAHGGTVRAVGQPGRGSVFTIELPKSEAPRLTVPQLKRA